MDFTLTITLTAYEKEMLRRYLEKVGGNEEEAAAGVTTDESIVAEQFYSVLE
jgi:hypothetical protein